MIDQETIKKLYELNLRTMAESFKEQSNSIEYKNLTFEERFAHIVEKEWLKRKNNKLKKLITQSSFKFPNACLEDIEYLDDRNLNKQLILKLSLNDYITTKKNIIITGASGSGKTYIACALGISACRGYYPVKYIRLPELFNELSVARCESNFQKKINQYKKIQLLIIDEWLLNNLKVNEAHDLFEIIESRHEYCSTIFCSQFAIEGWHERIGQKTLADAILDRIIHNTYDIFIEGKMSMRERKSIRGK